MIRYYVTAVIISNRFLIKILEEINETGFVSNNTPNLKKIK